MDQPSTTRRLQGRRALVTGGGSGIGLATVRRLAAEGAAVAVLDARADAAKEAADTIVAGGGRAIGLTADVGDEAQVAAAVAAAVDAWGGLDTLVTCAGVARVAATHDLSLADWEMVLRINLTGTFLPIRHALLPLMAAGSASIVTIGSVASVVAAGGTCSYDASKGGVLQLTRSIAVEYVDHGIRANCVLPGVVATGLHANTQALYGDKAPGERGASATRLRIPMDRRAHPDEIAGVVAFLASDDASFVTGAAIAADGGFTAI